MLLGCVCFGWKWFQEIIFTLFRMFGCHRKWYFPENDFRLTNIFTFDPEMIFSPHFHFKAFPEKERERGRARARERGEETEQLVDLQAAPISSLSSRQRDLAKIAISRRRELAPQIAIDTRRREIAISNRSRDRAVASSHRWSRDRDLRSRSLMIFFLGLCFPSSFPNTKKYFTGKFFEMQPNTEKYFPFPEISISGKYVFSGKRFTATKHSLRAYITKPF